MCYFLVLCSRLVQCPILCAMLNSNVTTLHERITNIQDSVVLLSVLGWKACLKQYVSWDAACVFCKGTQGVRWCCAPSLSWWETKALYCKCRSSLEWLSAHAMHSSCQCIQVKMLTILSELAVVIETILLYPVSPRRACTYSYIQ